MFETHSCHSCTALTAWCLGVFAESEKDVALLGIIFVLACAALGFSPSVTHVETHATINSSSQPNPNALCMQYLVTLDRKWI